MKKKVLSIILVLCLLFGIVPIYSLAEDTPAPYDTAIMAEIDNSDQSTWPVSGAWGSFTWSMDTFDADNYILTISGSGDMPDLSGGDRKPWYPWRVNTVRLVGPRRSRQPSMIPGTVKPGPLIRAVW